MSAPLVTACVHATLNGLLDAVDVLVRLVDADDGLAFFESQRNTAAVEQPPAPDCSGSAAASFDIALALSAGA